MSRIRKAYETRFRWMLEQLGARRVDQGVRALLSRARELSLREGLSPADALTRTHEDLARRTALRPGALHPEPALFYCDAGLGGLARWLRAAGYSALWEPGIDDSELLKRAAGLRATLLTTDSMLMERRLLRDRVIPSFWLPPTLSIPEQLALVFREFGLKRRPPRCMSCGGVLRRADKEALRERIPPKTFLWLDEYFLCEQCGKLFWHGTHWHRIVRTLAEFPTASPE